MKRVALYYRRNNGQELASPIPDAFVKIGAQRFTFHKVAPVAIPGFVVSA